jgi:hypothetical protein
MKTDASPCDCGGCACGRECCGTPCSEHDRPMWTTTISVRADLRSGLLFAPL